MPARRILLRTIAASVAIVCGPAPQAAIAHTEVVRATPQDGARLAHAPRSVQLRFGEAVDAGRAQIQVQDARGRRVDRGPVFHPGDRDAVVAVRLDRDARGALAIGWRVVSDDGHPETGTLRFRVAAGGPAAADAAEVAAPAGHAGHDAGTYGAGRGGHGGGHESPLAAAVAAAPFGSGAAPAPQLEAEPRATAVLGDAVRAGHALAVTLALGLVLFLLFAWPARRGVTGPRRALEGSAGRVVRAVAVAGLPLALAGAWLEGAAIAGVGPLDVRSADAALTALDGRAGCGWGLAIAGWSLLLWRLRGRRAVAPSDAVALSALGLVVAAPVLCGHADGLVLPVAATHVVAVAVWIGGLPALLLAGRAIRRAGLPGRDSALLARAAASGYSRLALPAALAVVATGAIQSLVRLATPLELLTTGYGRLLAVKIVAVAGLLALGAANRSRVLPRLQGHTAGAATALLRRTVAAELAIAVVVFGATGMLTGAAPPS